MSCFSAVDKQEPPGGCVAARLVSPTAWAGSQPSRVGIKTAVRFLSVNPSPSQLQGIWAHEWTDLFTGTQLQNSPISCP